MAPAFLLDACAQVGASGRATFTRESKGRVPDVVLRHVANRDLPVLGCGSMVGCLWFCGFWLALKFWVLNDAKCGVR